MRDSAVALVAASVAAGATLVAAFLALLTTVYASRRQRESAERIEALRAAQEDMARELARQSGLHEWTRNNQLDTFIRFAAAAQECERAYADWCHRFYLANERERAASEFEEQRWRLEKDGGLREDWQSHVLEQLVSNTRKARAGADEHRKERDAASVVIRERRDELEKLIERISWTSVKEVVDAANSVRWAHFEATAGVAAYVLLPDAELRELTGEMRGSRKAFRAAVRAATGH